MMMQQSTHRQFGNSPNLNLIPCICLGEKIRQLTVNINTKEILKVVNFFAKATKTMVQLIHVDIL